MKKKIITLLILAISCLGLISCGNKITQTEAASVETYEIAMITGDGHINDKSINQKIWDGISVYAEKNKTTNKYYVPASKTNGARLEAIQKAVESGAKIIITSGNDFSDPVYKAQDLYPEASFVLIDGQTHDASGSDYKTSPNTTCIMFAEEELGYLAGFAAVKDGYTKLGFIGISDEPEIIRYGYGFVQGANDAALEKGIFVEMKYNYTGVTEDSPDADEVAALWYSEGTEVIFGCGGNVGEAVINAAKTSGAKAIGRDIDPKAASGTILTSAVKDSGNAVKIILEKYYAGEFPGSRTATLSAAENAIGLAMEESIFRSFSDVEYEKVYDKLAKDYITVPRDTDVTSADLITLTNVMVSIR